MTLQLGTGMVLALATLLPAPQANAQDPVAGAIVGGALGGIVVGALGRGGGGRVPADITDGAMAVTTAIRTARGRRCSCRTIAVIETLSPRLAAG
jgi:outer membrane lipoprotein SlyB